MSDAAGRSAAERVARALMYVGAGLGALAVAAWALDAIPPMPEWMLRLAIYKLTLVSAGGLLIAGAALRRAVRARTSDVAPRHLGEGAAPPFGSDDERAEGTTIKRSRQ